MKDFLITFLGGMTTTLFFAYWLWAFIGMVFHLFIDILRRKKTSPYSPHEWDWGYWWADNRRKIIVSLVALPFAVLFGKSISGAEMNIYLAFCAGYLIDNFLDVLKQKEILKGCKLKNKE